MMNDMNDEQTPAISVQLSAVSKKASFADSRLLTADGWRDFSTFDF